MKEPLKNLINSLNMETIDIKGMNYKEFRDFVQNKYNELPIKWAFSDKQFKELLDGFGLKDTEEDLAKLCKVYGGGIMLKTEAHLLDEFENKEEQWYNDYFDGNEQHVYDALVKEFGNYECQIDGDGYEQATVAAIHKTTKEVEKDKGLLKIWKKAKKDFWQKCIDNDWF